MLRILLSTWGDNKETDPCVDDCLQERGFPPLVTWKLACSAKDNDQISLRVAVSSFGSCLENREDGLSSCCQLLRIPPRPQSGEGPAGAETSPPTAPPGSTPLSLMPPWLLFRNFISEQDLWCCYLAQTRFLRRPRTCCIYRRRSGKSLKRPFGGQHIIFEGSSVKTA